MKKILFGLFMASLAQTLFGQQLTGVSSTNSEKWLTIKKQNFASKPEENGEILTVYPSQKLQKIDGFGGCFNELGWEALQSLDEKERSNVLTNLFAVSGANFTLCRMPVGASDYALSWYSLNDVPDDFTMRNFNIDRDRYILIPYIKAAQQINPALKIWASPWSPPAWMKVNNHYTMKAGKAKENGRSNEMDSRKTILNNATAFKMEEGYLEAYALYFSKFVQTYKKEGIDIGYIQPQNEIAWSPQWPSCTWRPEDMSYFIKNFLGPQFKKDSLKTEIWLGTVNFPKPDYVRTILNDTVTSKYISGVGFQWSGKNAIGTIAKEYPQFKLMQTESECGEGENNWKSAEHTWSLIKHYLSNGANSYMYWNMVLDSSGKSSWDWPQNMLISINKETKEVKYNPEFYLFKHISHFVLPGAHQIKTSEGKDHLAFINEDGTITLVLINLTEATRNINIKCNGKAVAITLKAKSISTFNWK